VLKEHATKSSKYDVILLRVSLNPFHGFINGVEKTICGSR
jgi:hypothetical protein